MYNSKPAAKPSPATTAQSQKKVRLGKASHAHGLTLEQRPQPLRKDPEEGTVVSYLPGDAILSPIIAKFTLPPTSPIRKAFDYALSPPAIPKRCLACDQLRQYAGNASAAMEEGRACQSCRDTKGSW